MAARTRARSNGGTRKCSHESGRVRGGSCGTNGGAALTALTLADATRDFTIGARGGSYAGAPAQRGYTIRWVGVAAPAAVLCDGQPLSARASGEGYGYEPIARTLTATLDPRDGTRSHTLALR